jgi:Protein of unknown function (DUF3237)
LLFYPSFGGKGGFAQTAPALEYVCTLKINVDKPLVVGETKHGIRRVVPILGGSFDGPTMKGEVLNGGADWQVVSTDNTKTELEALYQLKTDDGVVIFVRNVGLRVASLAVTERLLKGDKVDASEYYFRAAPVFEAPKNSKYAWLNNAIFVCKGIRMPNLVQIEVWKVL